MSKEHTPFRYDHVGSFLRPAKLKQARLDFMWGFNGVGHAPTQTGLPFHGEAAMIDDAYLTGKVSLDTHPFVEHFKFVKALEDENSVAKLTIPAPAQFI